MHLSGHLNEPKTTGSDMCLVENRDVENFSNLKPGEIANHVWESCKPGGSFMLKAPTVSARRVQLMRVYLQSFVPDAESEEPDQCNKPSKLSSRPTTCSCGNPMRRGDSKMISVPDNSLTDIMYSRSEGKDDDFCEDENDDEHFIYE